MPINVNLNETVTLQRSTYEEMKSEIERLRRENSEKTIYKEVPHPAFSYALLALAILACFAWAGLFH